MDKEEKIVHKLSKQINQLASLGTPATLVIAASNSTTKEKDNAGFVCNGTSDAVDIASQIMTKLLNGGKVLFLSGQYNLSQRLFVRGISNLTFEGMGDSTVFKLNNGVTTSLASGANAGATQIIVSSVTGFEVGQDIFIGSTPDSGSSSYHISITPAAPYWESQKEVAPAAESNIITAINGTTITLAYALTNTYAGGAQVITIYEPLFFDSCDNLKILNLALDGNQANQIVSGTDIFQNGLRITACNDYEISGCYIHDVVFNHIMCHPSNSLRGNIHNNRIKNAGYLNTQTRGISVENLATGTLVSENQASGLACGLYTVGNQVTFANNYIYNCSTGLMINGTNYAVSIEGNTIDSCTNYGLYIPGSVPGTIISNNIICNTAYNANASVDIRGSFVDFVNNIFINDGGLDLRLYGGTHNKISGNLFVNGSQHASGTSGYDAIRLQNNSTNNIVENNTIKQTGVTTYYRGINISDAGSINNLVRDNSIANCYTNAIVHASATGNILERNNGYNPVGVVGPPAVPSSTVAYTNAYGFSCRVFVTGGTVSAIAINGTATGLTSGSFTLASGDTITLTYTIAPTWTWFGL